SRFLLVSVLSLFSASAIMLLCTPICSLAIFVKAYRIKTNRYALELLVSSLTSTAKAFFTALSSSSMRFFVPIVSILLLTSCCVNILQILAYISVVIVLMVCNILYSVRIDEYIFYYLQFLIGSETLC